jgi:hypothetical protein
VRPALAPSSFAIVWLAGSWLLTVAVLAASGPMRPGWFAQLGEHPRLQLELLLGLAAGGLAILGVGQLSIPSPRHVRARAVPALLALGAWTATCLWGLWDPAVPPSMAGKRAHCWVEILAWAAPLAILGLWLARRGAPLARTSTGALLGAAAASIPAVWMQVACMYDPAHILVYHLAPIGVVAILGAVLGPLVFRRI